MPSTLVPSDTDLSVAVAHYDGNSAVRHDAVLVASPHGFRLEGNGIERADYRFADLVPLPALGGNPAFGLKGRPGWRVALTAPPPPRLAALLPDARRYGGLIDKVGLWPAAIGFAAIAALCVTAIVLSPPLLARLIPRSIERQLADAMLGDFDDRFCSGPGGGEALQNLTDRLGVRDHDVDIRVVNLPIVNAVTLPGGHIVLFSGLIERAASPDEVAGVIAHELGHVDHRDVVESLIRQFGLSVVLGGLDGNVGGYTNALLSATYSRQTESRADAFAITTLVDNHISPAATSAFFDRLSQEELAPGATKTVLGYLATHPDSRARAKNFRAAARNDATYTPALGDKQWNDLQNICAADPKAKHSPFGF